MKAERKNIQLTQLRKSPSEKLSLNLISGDFEMCCDILKDRHECSYSQRTVRGNRHVMLRRSFCRKAEMTTRLTGHFITQNFECFGKIFPREIPREFHSAKSSSRTMWSRMTRGISASPKWHFTASRTATWSSAQLSASVKIDSPRARAVNPPSEDSSTAKMISPILFILRDLNPFDHHLNRKEIEV